MFQNKVNVYPAEGAPGLRAGINPVKHLFPVPLAVADVITGNACFFADSTNSSVKSAATGASATNGVLIGGAVDVIAVAKINNGTFKISVDSTQKAITGLNFSGVNSAADIAAIVNAALASASAGATAKANDSNTALIIISSSTGTSSAVSYATGNTGGTDVHEILKLTQAAGASSIAGTAGTKTKPVGIVQRNLIGLITGTEEAVNAIRTGNPVPVVVEGDVYVISAQAAIAGQAVFAKDADGSLIGGVAGASIANYQEMSWVVRTSAVAGSPFIISSK